MIPKFITKLFPWMSLKTLLLILGFLVIGGGLFHACHGPDLHFGWPPWGKSEYQKTKDLVDKTKDEVKKNNQKVDDIQKQIDASKKESKKLDIKRNQLKNKSAKISKDIKDAQDNIDKLDSLANGVF